MHGVPADLPLQPFVGQELNQIALGRFLVFEPGYRLTVFDDTPQYESFSVKLEGRGGVYV